MIIEKKNCAAKVLLAIWEIFLHENNRKYNSYRFSNKFAFILFLFSKPKKESGFQQVGGLVTRNISVFCLKWVALYFKAIPNWIDFCKGTILHVIPVRIIVPWYQSAFRKSHAFLSSLTGKILTDLYPSLITWMVLIDLPKAFDTINHEVLLRWIPLGFSNQSVVRFQSNYSNRSFWVNIIIKYSKKKNTIPN